MVVLKLYLLCKCNVQDWIGTDDHNWMHWFIYRVNWVALFGCRELIKIGGGFVAIARLMQKPCCQIGIWIWNNLKIKSCNIVQIGMILLQFYSVPPPSKDWETLQVYTNNLTRFWPSFFALQLNLRKEYKNLLKTICLATQKKN